MPYGRQAQDSVFYFDDDGFSYAHQKKISVL